jgi:hypothetical protein
MADCASKTLRGARLAILVAGGSLLATAAALPARAAEEYLFGIDDKQQILQINPTTKEQAIVLNGAPIICAGLDPADAALCAGADGGRDKFYSNNFAYDESRRQFYFMDFRGNLRYWDFQSSDLPIVATKNQIGLDQVSNTQTQFTANGAFHNGSFYYFIDSFARDINSANPPVSPDRNKLVQFAISYDGSGKPTGGTASKFDVPGLPVADGNPANDFTFGDIAINSSGTLYGANANGAFFTLDLNSCSGSSCASPAQFLINGSDAVRNPSLQLAFENDFLTLYGHTFSANSNGTTTAAGGWGTVDMSTGVYSPFSGSEAYSSTPLRDIAGGSAQKFTVPGPLPVLGAGAAFGWTRRLRRRLAGAQAAASKR